MSDKIQQTKYYQNLIDEIDKKLENYGQLKAKLNELRLCVDSARDGISNADDFFNEGGFIYNHKVFESETVNYCRTELWSISIFSIIAKINKKMTDLTELRKEYSKSLMDLTN